MKMFLYLLVGILFGIVMAKAELVSWFRIYEMFRFEAFHMYGVIGSAVILGAILVQFIKRKQLAGTDGDAIAFQPKDKSFFRYLCGGTIFGLGWALSGACPGPMFVLIGMGYWPILIVVAGAIFGTFVYGLLRPYLPH